MASGLIILNVGGHLYTTTRSTLERAPFIDALLRNGESMGNASFEGNPFIDRDGELFKDILAFLRSGLPIVANFPVQLLRQEADFYGIKDFHVLDVGKKLFLPASTKHEETIRGYFHDCTRSGQERYVFSAALPADVPTQAGSGGVQGCVQEKDLSRLGFKLVEADRVAGASPKPASGSEVSSESGEEFVFRRTVIKHYVDSRDYSVPDDGSTWDVVEIRESNGQAFAVVTQYQ